MNTNYLKYKMAQKGDTQKAKHNEKAEKYEPMKE